MKVQTENMMDPIYTSTFPTTKTSKTVNKRPNIPNTININLKCFLLKYLFYHELAILK